MSCLWSYGLLQRSFRVSGPYLEEAALSDNVSARDVTRSVRTIWEHADINTVATLQVDATVTQRSAVAKTSGVTSGNHGHSQLRHHVRAINTLGVSRNLFGEQNLVVTGCRNRSGGATGVVENEGDFRLVTVVHTVVNKARGDATGVINVGIHTGEGAGTGSANRWGSPNDTGRGTCYGDPSLGTGPGGMHKWGRGAR